jgi:hypothetical protein
VLADEVHYVRMNKNLEVVESYVPVTAMQGGNCRFRREDLLHELHWEDRALDTQIRLNGVDKELHDSYATRKEYMEVKCLHGFRTLLWTSNARRALEREHNKLCATVVAGEIVNDILLNMLEGWYFGERESNFTVAGFVPSINKDGIVRAGRDQLVAQKSLEQRQAEKDEQLAKGLPVAEAARGTPHEKAQPIEKQAQWQLSNEKVVKKGDARDQELDFTENTLRFGIFCITFMYFRAMSLLKREQQSWSGQGDAIGIDTDTGKVLSAERRRMQDEARRAEERARKMEQAMGRAKVGEERKRLREEKEKAEAAAKLHEKVRREKREKEAAAVLERTYRGHLGRKAARRWAMKKAELSAMNALMNASAITMQRVWRGYMGRLRASEVRMEMAEFIAMIRMEEAAADEEEYWRTHMFARFKRTLKLLIDEFMNAQKSGETEDPLAI